MAGKTHKVSFPWGPRSTECLLEFSGECQWCDSEFEAEYDRGESGRQQVAAEWAYEEV
jgi:hypothetical protein